MFTLVNETKERNTSSGSKVLFPFVPVAARIVIPFQSSSLERTRWQNRILSNNWERILFLAICSISFPSQEVGKEMQPKAAGQRPIDASRWVSHLPPRMLRQGGPTREKFWPSTFTVGPEYLLHHKGFTREETPSGR